MNVRIAALCGAFTLVLTACPPPENGPDGGTDAGNDGGQLPTGNCTGPCGPNQVCDEAQRRCVPGCNPGCTANQLCVRNGDTFECIVPQTSCSGMACEAGQNACITGSCSCLPIELAARDTCAEQGQTCDGAFNPVTMTGGQCQTSELYGFCKKGGCPDGECADCGPGRRCTDELFGTFGICSRICEAPADCAADEWCFGTDSFGGKACWPRALGGWRCQLPDPASTDGGTLVSQPSQLCLRLGDDGKPTETTPTGTCSWVQFSSDTQVYNIAYCRTPGPIAEGGACSTEQMPKSLANECATGLECVPTGEAGAGICLRICNAHVRNDGAPSEPACQMGEACVNIYRAEEPMIVGACMTACNVFSTEANFGCQPYGTTQTSCVPTSAEGVQRVTTNGSGICIPQLPDVKAAGEPCVSTDPLTGAACQSGLVCAQLSGQTQPQCVQPCDLECVAGDAGTPTPARCATEANATCGSGQTCSSVTGTSGAILGFCL